MISKYRPRLPGSLCRVFISVAGTLGVAGSVASQESPLLDCVISPHRVVDLASPVPGVIGEIFFEKSDLLQAGDVVAKLEASVELATVTLAEARANIDSEVQVNSVNYNFDKRRKERIASLYEKKTVSIDLKDEADREQSLSRWRLQQARDLKSIRSLELARAEQQLNQKTIRSPIDGFVLKRFKDVGEYVEEQPIMRIAQLHPLTVEALVPLEMRSSISSGMSALMYPDMPGELSYKAEVALIDQVADSGSVGIRLTLPNPDFEILSGVKCMLSLEAATKSDQ